MVLGQYCGTYAGGVRDDRVQILTTDGDQVVTIQDSGIDGASPGPAEAGDLVTVTAYEGRRRRHLRLRPRAPTGSSGSATRSPAGRWADRPPTGHFLWDTPVNNRHGATQWLGQLVS